MTATVTATVAATQVTAQQNSSSTNVTRQAQVALYAASEEAHRTTENFMRDYYENREFDPYLRFSSKQDEDDYRKRETERQKAIEDALAKHTPEGNLEANRLAIEQLKDAGVHGADRSAQFKPELDALESSRKALAAQTQKTAEPTKSAATETEQLSPQKSQKPALPADLLATIRATEMKVADQNASGHGVAAAAPQQQPERGRS